MEKETFLSGYCRGIDQSRMVAVVTEDGELVEVQRVNRIYATSNERYGMIYKVKLNDRAEVVRKDKLANCPARCLIDNENTIHVNQIDSQFYIDLAHKRINDFKGIKTKRATKAKKR